MMFVELRELSHRNNGNTSGISCCMIETNAVHNVRRTVCQWRQVYKCVYVYTI